MRALLVVALGVVAANVDDRIGDILDRRLSSPQDLCPSSAHGGSFIGLVVDDVYTVRAPQDGSPERWELVDETTVTEDKRVANSFCGVYLQVLPDDGDDYNSVFGPKSFVWTAVEFKLRVPEKGTYTLFARWSGGDVVGGGDSFYVLVADAAGNVVEGAPTWKEKKVPIDETPGAFSGCCYDTSTHACPCSTELEVDGKQACEDAEGYWVATADAVKWGATCVAGEGLMEPMAPLWYEFAGQEYGNVMDFDSEPWDATCEAQGTGTADSGRDEATWELEAGTYTMKFYPREDGTALDAIYVAPFGASPPEGLVLAEGQSSTCPKSASSSSSSSSGGARAWSVLGSVVLVVALVVLVGLAVSHPRVRAKFVGLVNRAPADAPGSPTYFEMSTDGGGERGEAFIVQDAGVV